ncbi:MAG: TolC family protein [Bacteroidales bacterium]|nr:TolC family protein [Bacteroidales bacterium]MCB9028374.1 TolC family protein [Bacteroidales bacterium]HPE23106.1 TolC family protein [Bacteroidales bacterium]HPJ05749.1 TolC family protein [Bacteroidales bacterium]
MSTKLFHTMAALLWVVSVSVHAQPEQWTLTDCIGYALEQNIQVRKADVSVSLGELNLQQAKDNMLPSLSASLGENLGLQRMTASTGEVSWDGSSRTSASLSSGLTLFNGFQLRNRVRLAALDQRSLQYSADQTRESVSLSIMSGYLQVLYAEEQVANSRNQAEATREELALAGERMSLGAISNSDYLQVKTQLASEEATLATAENNLKMARLNLMQLMEYPVDESFETARPDIDAVISSIPIADASAVYEEALRVKPQVQIATLNRESAALDLEIARGGFFPSVSVNAGMSTGFTQVAEMGSQLKNGFSPSLGLTASIPIFRNNQNRVAVSRAQYGITIAELDELNTRNQLRKEVEQAVLDTESARLSYLAALNRYEASLETYSVSEEKFKLGAMNSVDFLIQKTNLTAAESNLLQAKYEMVYSHKIIDFYRGVPLSF